MEEEEEEEDPVASRMSRRRSLAAWFSWRERDLLANLVARATSPERRARRAMSTQRWASSAFIKATCGGGVGVGEEW